MLKEHVDNKKIGKIFSVRCEVGQNLMYWRKGRDYRSSVTANRNLGGGVLLELSHELDYLSWIFGPCKWVRAWIGNVSDLEVDVEDSANLLLGMHQNDTDQDLICSLNMDFVRQEQERSCTVIGEHGTVKWNGCLGIVEIYSKGTGVWKTVYSDISDVEQSYTRQFKSFLNSINKNQFAAPSVKDGINVLKIIASSHESSSQVGKQININ